MTDHMVGRDRFAGIMLFAAWLSLLAGLAMPVLHIRRFFLFSDYVSLPAIVWRLFEEGENAVGLLLLLFTIVFPVAKLAWLSLLWWRPVLLRRPVLSLLGTFGRWSMLDILVLALVIFSAKASGLATAATEPALHAFAAAVILGMSASMRLEGQERRQAAGKPHRDANSR